MIFILSVMNSSGNDGKTEKDIFEEITGNQLS